MVDSSPSGARSARDPDHPASDDARSSDPEADDEQSEDERWLRELAALAARSDPAPGEVAQAARNAFKARGAKRKSG
jgi:hypothetical protein